MQNVINSEATIEDVKNFWNANPLMTLEILNVPGSLEFFELHHYLKMTESELFAYNFWEFDRHKDDKVLDIGCGPGWLVRQFAQHGTDVTGVDLSINSLKIAKQGLAVYNLKANLVEGNAEQLPFPDHSFDYVVCSGVLHHTPDTGKAFQEAYRVLKPGGTATISLYYKNILLRPLFFGFVRFVFNVLGGFLPGREGMNSAKTSDEFVRMYDGDKNPVGRAYTVSECKSIVQPFKWCRYEIHYFPARFIPGFKRLPKFILKLLDGYFGTMIYMKLTKPNE